nr:hypothetical protein [Brucella anthropi]
MNPLPEWTKAMVPVGMDDAAMLLGVSRRFLMDKLKSHPFYERRGSKKVFYPEHIALLREALSCQTLNSKTATASGMPLAQSPESAYEKALELATNKSRSKSGRNTKRACGKVIPMVRKP